MTVARAPYLLKRFHSSDDNLKAAAALLPLLKENNFEIPEDDGNCAFSKAFQSWSSPFILTAPA